MAARLTLAAVAVAGLATLAGCSSAAVHGTVTGKTYIPSSTTYVNTPVYGQRCTTSEEEEEEEEPGPNGTEEEEPEEESVTNCTSYLSYWHLVPAYHDDCWQLTVEGKQGGAVCVSEAQYDSAKIGGSW
jgi:hypothetical protein